MRNLLAYRANVQALDSSGLNPPQESAEAGSSGDKVVSAFLEHGANPHSVTNRNLTPLHLTAERRGKSTEDPRVVRVLPQNGADVDARDDLGRAFGYQDTIIKALLEHRADVNAIAQKGETALRLAVQVQRHFWRTVVRTLLQHGADPNTVDAEARTVFHRALNPGELHKLLVYQVI